MSPVPVSLLMHSLFLEHMENKPVFWAAQGQTEGGGEGCCYSLLWMAWGGAVAPQPS